MKLFLIVLLLVGIAHASKEYHETEDQFEDEFGIKDPPGEEKDEEAKNLAAAEAEINQHNKDYAAGKSTYEEKLNEDSDLDQEDYEKEKEGALLPDTERIFSYGAIMPPESVRNDPVRKAIMDRVYEEIEASDRQAPASVDSVALGKVTPARNQKSCGSCAAFSAMGLHETCMMMAGAKMSGLDLSEQYLVDCGFNPRKGMNGCNGAWPHAYQEWFKGNGGQAPHEARYPYRGGNPLLNCGKAQGLPKFNSGAKVAQVMSDFRCSESKLKALIAQYGAVSVAIYASDRGFGNYAKGVFQGCSSKRINHAVLAVGYGTEGGVPYWLVKNSWGGNWGDKGFIKMRRGTNECGIEGICVAAKCTKTTGKADPPPPVTTTPAPPPALTCDVSKWVGKITGRYRFRFRRDGVLIDARVTCNRGICRPTMPGPTNACMYLCRRTKCP